MTQIIIFFTFLLSLSAALDSSRDAKILQYAFENTGTGPYHFNFATSDGTSREEQGTLINPNTKDSAVIMKGSYSYTDGSGKVYTVRYTADENGFHPEGDHIKVPPFVPWIKHHHHLSDEIDNNLQDNINPTTKIYLPSTPAPPRPQPAYIPSTPRPNRINPFPNSTPTPTVSGNNAYVAATPRNDHFEGLDPKLQESILSLLSAGDERGLSIEQVNSI